MTARVDHLVLDCDPGCDDAIALAMLLKSKRYSPISVLTSGGNVCVEETTANACRIIALWRGPDPKSVGDADVRIYGGASTGLMAEESNASSVHGRDGLGEVPNRLFGLSEEMLRTCRPEKLTAPEHLLRLIDSGEHFDYLCTGPMTNLALTLAMLRDPGVFWKHCNVFVVMGGSFGVGGNITPLAEFNAFFDPVAVQMVLDSWKHCHGQWRGDREACVHFVPLDVTELIDLSLSDDDIQKPTDPLGKFVLSSLRMYGLFHARECIRHTLEKQENQEGVATSATNDIARMRAQRRLLGSSDIGPLIKFCYLHDPTAAWVLTEEAYNCDDLWEDCEIRVNTDKGLSRGEVVIVHSKPRPVGAAGAICWGTPVRVLGGMGQVMDPDRIERIKRIKKGVIDAVKSKVFGSEQSMRCSPSSRPKNGLNKIDSQDGCRNERSP